MKKDNEIIEKWYDFSDAMKMLEINENPTANYWEIWNDIDDIFRVRILQQPDIDYEKYINICDENKKRLLYTNNKKLMSNDLDWDNLSEKLRSFTTLNPNFDFEPYWDRMSDENKRTIINREKFNFDKYWDDLTLSQSLAYLKTSEQITNKEYQEQTGCSDRTASRDLKDLVEKGILRSSKIRGVGAFYELITPKTPQ